MKKETKKEIESFLVVLAGNQMFFWLARLSLNTGPILEFPAGQQIPPELSLMATIVQYVPFAALFLMFIITGFDLAHKAYTMPSRLRKRNTEAEWNPKVEVEKERLKGV